MRQAFGANRALLLAQLEGVLESGADFSTALAESPLGFDRMLILSARVGEKSGTLAQSLRAAALKIDRRCELEASLTSALIYPAIIFLASSGIISFLVFYIMPKIIPTLESLHVPLPAVTRFFIFQSHFLVGNWWKIISIGIFAAAAFIFFYTKNQRFRVIAQEFILRVPMIAPAVRAHMLSETLDIISTLVSAGCPFVEAVQECAAFLSLVPYQQAFSIAIREMQTGSDFSGVLARYPRLFPDLAVQGIAIGERTGNMENVLPQISRYYATELQGILSGFSKIIEPALMIVVGIIVGAAALSIVLPVYGISQHLSG
jgi:type IV pilus assembly protein PilC